ncbi:surface polysaccharide O-acyltransferase-like enzyme [Enterobacter sp. BIGb0383]|uniref:acyltransferase n=1 Tax=unclassified Enterobacter TaxID=2608935 RepID=UPI000FA3F5B3|nr:MULTISPECIES: acyltransferase [unclassified Enterobacter]ROP62392.1 surface polysaccharide O-acyltransferase-like enzyme [Enterobacter sp. BIGb0383]ROS12553.1 surface polysaccharide O-acyltransferase-like enzyme [Enterobacter sp. BIGb0359]
MRKERDIGMDVLRVLCCVLVIAIHVTPPGITESGKITSIAIQGFVRVGLPVFFVISGMYLLNQKIDNIFTFYRKRIPFLVIPFLVYSFIHFMTHYISLGVTDAKMLWDGYLIGLSAPTGISVHFWFVYSLLGIYLISPLLSRFISAIDERSAIYFIIALLAIRAYNQYLKQYIPFIDIPELPVWVTYFIVGGLAFKIREASWKLCLCLIVGSYIATSILSFYQFNGAIQTNLALYDAGVNMFIFAVSLCIMFKNLTLSISERLKSILSSVSENTYGAFLIHILVFKFIMQYVDNNWYNEKVAISSLFITMTVFTLSLAISYAINLIVVNPTINATRSKSSVAAR